MNKILPGLNVLEGQVAESKNPVIQLVHNYKFNQNEALFTQKEPRKV